MTGHIRRRGERSWELKFDVGADPVTGKRQIRYASFKGTKRDAEIELSRLVTQNAAGEGVDPSKATVAEFLERWERDWASVNVSPKTLERYKQILRLNIIPHIGATRVQKLRPVHLNELYAKLQRTGGHNGRPLSPRSVGHVHRVLHRALGHAATWGVVSQNIAAVVAPPPVPDDGEIIILTEEQIGTTLRHLEGRTLRPIVSFLLGTGARRGEALALRWKDLQLDKAIVRIERSLEQTKGALRFKAPKTKKGRRNVAISPWLVAELRTHRARQQERRMALGLGRAADDSLVFARWDGSTRSPHWLTQKFAQAMDSLKIDCTLHGLRHTHVSQLIASGLDVLTISRRIGHASAAITLKVYGHLFANTDTRAAEIMEATFAKVRSTE
jgi:integrase